MWVFRDNIWLPKVKKNKKSLTWAWTWWKVGPFHRLLLIVHKSLIRWWLCLLTIRCCEMWKNQSVIYNETRCPLLTSLLSDLLMLFKPIHYMLADSIFFSQSNVGASDKPLLALPSVPCIIQATSTIHKPCLDSTYPFIYFIRFPPTIISFRLLKHPQSSLANCNRKS